MVATRSNRRQSKLAFEPGSADDVTTTPKSTPATRSGKPSGRANGQSRLTSYGKKNEPRQLHSPPTSSLKGRASTPDYAFGEQESSGDEVMFTEPMTNRKLLKRKRDEFVIPDDESEASDEDSDDVVVRGRASSPKQRVLHLSEKQKGKRRAISSSDESENEKDGGEKEENSDSNSDSEAPVRRRRLLKTPTKTENEEILDELDDLREDSPAVDSTAKNRKLAESRREALAKMRRARLGADSNESGLDTDETENEDEDEEEDLPLLGQPEYEDGDEDGDDFIEEDDGSPSAVQLPFAFSNAAASSAKDMFDDMLRWIVHLILRDVVLDDPLYTLAHDKLQRQLGQWGESFRSSIWRPNFLYAMLARPEIHTYGLVSLFGDHARGDHCEGCNRSDTYSTQEVRFAGNPYDPLTLRDLEQDEQDETGEDDESGEGDAPLVDGHGRELRTTSFVLGKTCFHNAMLAHPLAHWKYRLKTLVRSHLGVQLTRREVRERELWPEEDRVQHADDVADELVRTGVASRIWSEFKASTSQAWHTRSHNS